LAKLVMSTSTVFLILRRGTLVPTGTPEDNYRPQSLRCAVCPCRAGRSWPKNVAGSGKVDQRVQAVDGLGPDRSTRPAVATIRATVFDCIFRAGKTRNRPRLRQERMLDLHRSRKLQSKRPFGATCGHSLAAIRPGRYEVSRADNRFSALPRIAGSPHLSTLWQTPRGLSRNTEAKHIFGCASGLACTSACTARRPRCVFQNAGATQYQLRLSRSIRIRENDAHYLGTPDSGPPSPKHLRFGRAGPRVLTISFDHPRQGSGAE